MLVKRNVFAVFMVAVVATVAWLGVQNISAQGGGSNGDILIDADMAVVNQIVGTGSRSRDGFCSFGGSVNIEGTLGDGEMSEEITVAFDDDCRLIVENIVRVTQPPDESDVLMSSDDHTDWEVYANLKLWGYYQNPDDDDDEPLPVSAETDIEFRYRETNTSLSFNYPLPEKWCQSTPPAIVWRTCTLKYVTNTSTKKSVRTQTRFTFNGVPQMTWDHHATYNAKLDASDTYRCHAGPHPGFLNWRCKGGKSEQ